MLLAECGQSPTAVSGNAGADGLGKYSQNHGQSRRNDRQQAGVRSKIALSTAVAFSIDPPCPPDRGVGISNEARRLWPARYPATTAYSWRSARTAETLKFPQIPLLKGRYFVSAYLACEGHPVIPRILRGIAGRTTGDRAGLCRPAARVDRRRMNLKNRSSPISSDCHGKGSQ